MSTLQIGLIQGTTAYATTNRSGGVNAASPGFTLWSSLTPPVPEGPDGSANCCTFMLPGTGDQIPISVSGVASFLPTTSQFVLQGLWNGIIMFQTPPLPTPPMTTNFVVAQNQLLFVGLPLAFACRLAGNWTWKMGPPGGNVEAPKRRERLY